MAEFPPRKFHCMKCNHNWDVPFGGGRQLLCPKCGSTRIHRTNPEEEPPWGRGKTRRSGWRRK